MTNLVVCCDGTWNTPEDMDHGLPCPTNVVKLYHALIQDGSQSAYYHPGVGTGKGWWDRVAGGGTGAGLDKNIMSGYQWLAYNYIDGANIFLFGFSRGAYTVRSLGGLISKCGLLDIRSPDLKPAQVWQRIQEVFDVYRDGGQTGFGNPNNYPMHDNVTIHFIGVWDTVGALGIPDDLALLGLFDDPEKYRFHDTTLGKSVKHARHAVALDEKRASFAPTLWTRQSSETFKQLWFAGVHSDVGGGYLEAGLSDGTLEWMMTEAKACGLKIRRGALEQLDPDPLGVVHDSCCGVFKVLKTQPRSVPQIGDGASELHPSALERRGNPPLAQGPYWTTQVLQPGESRTIDVFAVRHWNETGLFLEKDVTYEMTASGEWIDDKDAFTPGGESSTGFHLGDIARYASSMLGALETPYEKVLGSRADFWWTRRDEDAPWFALMGFIANSELDESSKLPVGEQFMIGEKKTVRPGSSGYLYCFANDAWHTYGNNRGAVALTVKRPR